MARGMKMSNPKGREKAIREDHGIGLSPRSPESGGRGGGGEGILSRHNT
jgi:hypothetical protein